MTRTVSPPETLQVASRWAEALRGIREGLKLTRASAANTAPVSARSIEEWENGGLSQMALVSRYLHSLGYTIEIVKLSDPNIM